MLILIKGAGDLASGVACRLFKAGFSIIMTEIAKPTVIRRHVSFAQAIYEGHTTVEGISAFLAEDEAQALAAVQRGQIPILIDPQAQCKEILKPDILIDAILAKKNIGTSITDAPMVIALGPGFIAGEDAHAVIETQRGHYLGRVYLEGGAIPNTGIPGDVGGKSIERLLKAPADGEFKGVKKIGDFVHQGEIMAYCGGQPLKSQIDGYLRGILMDGLEVFEGMKVGDVDPRCQEDHCFTISDKARSLGGAVLEAVLYLSLQNGFKLVKTEVDQ